MTARYQPPAVTLTAPLTTTHWVSLTIDGRFTAMGFSVTHRLSLNTRVLRVRFGRAVARSGSRRSL